MSFEEEGKKSTERWLNRRRCGTHVRVGELVEIAFDMEGTVKQCVGRMGVLGKLQSVERKS